MNPITSRPKRHDATVNRRTFIQGLTAGAYLITLPPILGLSSSTRDWGFTLQNIEVFPDESSFFGTVVRGTAVLDERPDVVVWWRVLVDDRFLKTKSDFDEMVETHIKPELQKHFRSRRKLA